MQPSVATVSVAPPGPWSGVFHAVILFMGLALTGLVHAQAPPSVPGPDASFDLPPIQPVAPEKGSPTPAQVADVDASRRPPGEVRFGLICLTRVEACSDSIVLLEAGDGWWVEEPVLEALGGGHELAVHQIAGQVWRLVPRGQASWDDENQKLVWDRPLQNRQGQDVYSARGDAAPPVRSHSIPSVALHYSATVDEKGNATIGTQAIASRGTTAFFAGGVYSQDRFVRDLWRMEHDDIDNRVRYIAGEQIIRPADPLGGAERIRGIAIERAYDIDPTLATNPRPGLHGIIEQPGVIDIYNNGRLVSSTPIQPGPYQWGNLPLGSGSQQIELVFRGADGSRSVLSSSAFYGSNRGLAKGLTDFSFRAGKPYDTNQSTDLAWQGWVRRGVSSNITLGGRVEGQGSLRNAGADASVSFGVGSIDMAYARDHDGEDAWSTNVSIARNGFDAQAGRTRLSPGYWFLGRQAQVFSGDARVVDERFVSAGYGAGAFSVRASLSERLAINGNQTRTSGLVGTWRSRQNWRWFATVDRVSQGTDSQYQASLGVAVPLGARRTQELEVRALARDQGRGGQVSWNRHHQEVYGWSANASLLSLPSGERGVVSGYERATPVGNLLLSGVKTNQQSFGLATWSGSIIRADDNWFASSPEQGPRVLVTSSTPQARIRKDNQPVGAVGSRGRLVSKLAPYSAINVQIEPSSLPLDADTSSLQKTLITPRTGVVKVDFDTTANGQVQGTLLIDGQPARLGVLALDHGPQGWVGESGRLWVEGLEPGTWPGTWTNGQVQRKCTVVVEDRPLRISSASCP